MEDDLFRETERLEGDVRSVTGPYHNGKGPRTHRRDVKRIREDICDRMTENRYLDPYDLEVDVQNGDVVLTGTANDRYAKRVADAISEAAIRRK